MTFEQTTIPGLGGPLEGLPPAMVVEPLLSEDDLSGASKAQLVDAVVAINTRLAIYDERAVIDAARRVVLDRDFTDRVVIRIGVDEYDDGFFYEGVDDVSDNSGVRLNLDEDVIDALESALAAPLAILSYNSHRPGRHSTLEIDLIRDELC